MSARRGFLLSVLIVVALAACGGEDRPDTASWLPQWEAITSVIPDQSALGDPPSEELCQTTLAAIRTENDGLLPSPSVTVDDLVTEWVAVAEAAFFDCPPEGSDIDSFAAAYEELGRIEHSVDTAIADDD